MPTFKDIEQFTPIEDAAITGKEKLQISATQSVTLSQIAALAKQFIPVIPTSLKNPYSAVIQLNGGTTEGTDKMTYDGSASKKLNITAQNVGAAPATHTHTKDQITNFAHTHTKAQITNFAHTHTKDQISDFPTSLKNPQKLQISKQGREDVFYDGSVPTEIKLGPDHTLTFRELIDNGEEGSVITFDDTEDVEVTLWNKPLNIKLPGVSDPIVYNGKRTQTVKIPTELPNPKSLTLKRPLYFRSHEDIVYKGDVAKSLSLDGSEIMDFIGFRKIISYSGNDGHYFNGEVRVEVSLLGITIQYYIRGLEIISGAPTTGFTIDTPLGWGTDYPELQEMLWYWYDGEGFGDLGYSRSQLIDVNISEIDSSKLGKTYLSTQLKITQNSTTLETIVNKAGGSTLDEKVELQDMVFTFFIPIGSYTLV